MSFGRSLKTNFSKELDVLICIFGDTQSGKSSIIRNFSNKLFSPNQTIDYKDQVVELLHSNERFLIQECSSKEMLEQKCTKNTNLIITSDLTKVMANPAQESSIITSYLQEFQKLSSHIILVGTKSDLVANYSQMQTDKTLTIPNQNESTHSSSQREIQLNPIQQRSGATLRRSSSIQMKKQVQIHPSQILKRIADQHGVHYIESSSKNNNNINLIFQLSSGNIQTELFMRDFQQGMTNQTQIQTKQSKNISNSNKDIIHLNNTGQEDIEDKTIYYSSCF